MIYQKRFLVEPSEEVPCSQCPQVATEGEHVFMLNNDGRLLCGNCSETAIGEHVMEQKHEQRAREALAELKR